MVVTKLISRLSIQRMYMYSSNSSLITRSQAPPANIERRDYQRAVSLELASRGPVEYVELTSSSVCRRAVGNGIDLSAVSASGSSTGLFVISHLDGIWHGSNGRKWSDDGADDGVGLGPKNCWSGMRVI